MRRHQGAKVEHFNVSNVIYHKFSHGAVSYTLNGENVNVILEYLFKSGITSLKTGIWTTLYDNMISAEVFFFFSYLQSPHKISVII